MVYRQDIPEGIIINDVAKVRRQGGKLITPLWSDDVAKEERGYICEIETRHLNLFQALHVAGVVTRVIAVPPVTDEVMDLLTPFD